MVCPCLLEAIQQASWKTLWLTWARYRTWALQFRNQYNVKVLSEQGEMLEQRVEEVVVAGGSGVGKSVLIERYLGF